VIERLSGEECGFIDGQTSALFREHLIGRFRAGTLKYLANVNVLTTVGWDLSRVGIQFVASPRHADGLLITGALSENMRLALRKTYDAVPEPKLVIAVGACAISGGPYIDHPEVANGVEGTLPIDLYIPGCPPHPLTILDGLLRLVGRLEGPRRAAAPVSAP
jgi:Ni,Fe-hydrogenase III small subunit